MKTNNHPQKGSLGLQVTGNSCIYSIKSPQFFCLHCSSILGEVCAQKKRLCFAMVRKMVLGPKVDSDGSCWAAAEVSVPLQPFSVM